jgi:hypothetical protein
MTEIQISPEEQKIESTLLDIADPIQFGAEEYWCAMRRLDALEITREHEGKELSIVGRINKATGTFKEDEKD